MAAPRLAAITAVLGYLVALAALASCSTEGDILYKQRLAWKDPKNVLRSWDPKLANPCTWFHVTCNNDNSVIRVDLGNAGISGPLIPDLGGLKNLQYLELYHNHLNGSIPTTLGNLTNLVSLDLYSNHLTGAIPTTLGTIGTLRYLNHLTGAIPTTLGAIGTLGYLRLCKNKLTGSIPESLGNLTNLEMLELQKNALNGAIPSSLGNIKTLKFLKLNANMLTGTVPLEVLSLVIAGNLTELNIAKNDLAGTVRSSRLRVTTIIQDMMKTT
ncbi:hypothetical protein SORBI_3005G125950 [Sorghum bicolor]|uniref:Leucine-rich repeat-containing N-terminal plant-type domain-containing protein n=1 Tax=Sorghum bicolor TaxID=4558 RepID=A0A1Z5RID4_SORBI|nr:hypothetical protein SORBI_3005G125950 [Sorghum bicolor]